MSTSQHSTRETQLALFLSKVTRAAGATTESRAIAEKLAVSMAERRLASS